MKELFTVITRKGQITVPVEIRKALKLKEGDRLAVSLPDPRKKEVSLRPAQSVTDRTYGVVPKFGVQPANLDDLRAEYEEGIGAEVAEEATPKLQT